ncbi:hypothetical protein EJM73_09565 [Clostridium botulinum]|uniref:homing endonuclease associated repeat-containing protein n=1 Tax=Clostridium botulinum TaxID=1491 RepID=UPI0013763D61|nr:hypothetical protein [Clostridium botulinum]NCI19873.1 hypothetical protein [Clostridium botulinum]NCI35911.1 hypothetical protein [Clostridium botulinum]NCI71768.1 hypothetical protein [Clostridium botulinum]
MNIKWTSEKIELLKKYYPNSSWDFLFKVLQCSNKESIIHKAYKLNIKRQGYYYTKEDIVFLKNNYNKMSIEELGKHLNKTSQSIMTKANNLKLHKTDKWSEDEMKLLERVYGKYTNKELSEKFFTNRNVESIRTMANKNNLKKDKKGVKKYNPDDMLEELQNLADKLGRTPKIPELRLYNLPSESSYRRYFGSYINACKLADLDINICLFGKKRKIPKSLNGDVCFSNAETIITDFFIKNNIKYIKEPYYKDYMDDERCKTKRCDWIIDNNVFVEYFGLPDKSYYYKKMEIKRQICKDNNIKLIELFEKDLDKLNTIF